MKLLIEMYSDKLCKLSDDDNLLNLENQREERDNIDCKVQNTEDPLRNQENPREPDHTAVHKKVDIQCCNIKTNGFLLAKQKPLK